MPRVARKKSATNIYHVMIRGINKQNIFVEDADFKKFINILTAYHVRIEYEIYAYCLLDNHVHLLIKEGNEPLSNTMRRIGTSYVYWYNWQYGRKGHLFQDRYKSEPVENDTYFLTVLRYIHQNPVQAGLSADIEGYQWSSYREYLAESKLVNVDFTFGLFHENSVEAKAMFIRFNKELNNDKCLEITAPRKTISDKEISQIIKHSFGIDLASLRNQQLSTQREVLQFLKKLDGPSLRQLSRLTGFTVNKIFRA
jgi:putative transposase